MQGRIAEVHGQRAAASQEFFARTAASFQAQQDLIAGLPQYRDSVLALLDSLEFVDAACAVEIGPGDGGFLPELAQRFQQVLALDNSAAMLELARQRCTEESLHNVQLQLADALQDDYPAADCLVLNMVLHHFAVPAEALKQLAQRVKPGGSLLITELCSHNQSWASAAGLNTCESLYVGLRNGFQIQVRHFAKPSITHGLRAAITGHQQEPAR